MAGTLLSLSLSILAIHLYDNLPGDSSSLQLYLPITSYKLTYRTSLLSGQQQWIARFSDLDRCHSSISYFRYLLGVYGHA